MKRLMVLFATVIFAAALLSGCSNTQNNSTASADNTERTIGKGIETSPFSGAKQTGFDTSDDPTPEGVTEAPLSLLEGYTGTTINPTSGSSAEVSFVFNLPEPSAARTGQAIAPRVTHIGIIVVQYQVDPVTRWAQIVNRDMGVASSASPTLSFDLYPTLTRVCAKEFVGEPDTDWYDFNIYGNALDTVCTNKVLSAGANTVTLTMLRGEWTLDTPVDGISAVSITPIGEYYSNDFLLSMMNEGFDGLNYDRSGNLHYVGMAEINGVYSQTAAVSGYYRGDTGGAVFDVLVVPAMDNVTEGDKAFGTVFMGYENLNIDGDGYAINERNFRRWRSLDLDIPGDGMGSRYVEIMLMGKVREGSKFSSDPEGLNPITAQFLDNCTLTFGTGTEINLCTISDANFNFPIEDNGTVIWDDNLTTHYEFWFKEFVGGTTCLAASENGRDLVPMPDGMGGYVCVDTYSKPYFGDYFESCADPSFVSEPYEYLGLYREYPDNSSCFKSIEIACEDNPGMHIDTELGECVADSTFTPLFDDFSTGDFSGFGWIADNWTVSTSVALDGQSAQTNIDGAVLSLDITMTEDGGLKFDYAMSDPSGFGYNSLLVYVNGYEYFYDFGNAVNFGDIPLFTGANTVEFFYYNGGDNATGVEIDNVSIGVAPVTLYEYEICNGNYQYLNYYVPGYGYQNLPACAGEALFSYGAYCSDPLLSVFNDGLCAMAPEDACQEAVDTWWDYQCDEFGDNCTEVNMSDEEAVYDNLTGNCRIQNIIDNMSDGWRFQVLQNPQPARFTGDGSLPSTLTPSLQ